MVPNHQSSRSRASVLSPADDSLDAPASMTGLDFHKKTQLGQLTSAELLNKIKHHQTMTQKQSAHVCACLRMSAHVCARCLEVHESPATPVMKGRQGLMLVGRSCPSSFVQI